MTDVPGDEPPPLWVAWAPPLDPPVDGGVPYAVAEGIADLYWATDPHLCAALQWEYYAAMQPPTPSVASVSTGVQSVQYQPAAPTGTYGMAMARAAWHRSFGADQLVSVPLITDTGRLSTLDPLADMTWWIDP